MVLEVIKPFNVSYTRHTPAITEMINRAQITSSHFFEGHLLLIKKILLNRDKTDLMYHFCQISPDKPIRKSLLDKSLTFKANERTLIGYTTLNAAKTMESFAAMAGIKNNKTRR